MAGSQVSFDGVCLRKTRSGYPSSIAPSNGGAGAWKWEHVDDSEYGMSNTSRDAAFAESFVHTAVDGSSTSLKGPVDCGE